jgi:MarR family transcriptional regulator, temperature-dependent positive regulator of motility
MAKTKGKSARAGGDGPLESSPSHLMHRVLQLALDIYAEETGPGALTQRQYAVLTAVASNEGLTQTDLVKATGIDRSTLADMVARMITKGFLERERSSLDGRANTVRLTEAGRAELESARPRVEAADKRILGLLPGGKRDSLINVLRAFSRAGEAALAADDASDGGKKKKKADKPAKRAKAEKPAKGEKPAKAAKPPKAERPEKKKKKLKKTT